MCFCQIFPREIILHILSYLDSTYCNKLALLYAFPCLRRKNLFPRILEIKEVGVGVVPSPSLSNDPFDFSLVIKEKIIQRLEKLNPSLFSENMAEKISHFFKNLHTQRGYISGSFLLQCFYGIDNNNNNAGWEASDIDVFMGIPPPDPGVAYNLFKSAEIVRHDEMMRTHNRTIWDSQYDSKSHRRNHISTIDDMHLIDYMSLFIWAFMKHSFSKHEDQLGDFSLFLKEGGFDITHLSSVYKAHNRYTGESLEIAHKKNNSTKSTLYIRNEMIERSYGLPLVIPAKCIPIYVKKVNANTTTDLDENIECNNVFKLFDIVCPWIYGDSENQTYYSMWIEKEKKFTSAKCILDFIEECFDFDFCKIGFNGKKLVIKHPDALFSKSGSYHFFLPHQDILDNESSKSSYTSSTNILNWPKIIHRIKKYRERGFKIKTSFDLPFGQRQSEIKKDDDDDTKDALARSDQQREKSIFDELIMISFLLNKATSIRMNKGDTSNITLITAFGRRYLERLKDQYFIDDDDSKNQKNKKRKY